MVFLLPSMNMVNFIDFHIPSLHSLGFATLNLLIFISVFIDDVSLSFLVCDDFGFGIMVIAHKINGNMLPPLFSGTVCVILVLLPF